MPLSLEDAERNLTLQELHDMLNPGTNEFEAYLDGDENRSYLLLYADDAWGKIEAPDGIHFFDTWEEMCSAPVFEGKTLREVISRLVVYW